MSINELKVLVCDDSLLARKRLKDCIISFGCAEVFEAADGEEAIAQFNTNKPNITFMDIVMPKIDGIEALKGIIEIDPEATVIMASSVGTQSYLKDAISAGATDFIQKPIDNERVKEIINSYCSREEF